MKKMHRKVTADATAAEMGILLIDPASSQTIAKPNVSGCFSVGKQFQRNPDAENGLIILTITDISKYKVELGSYGWKPKKWLSSNSFNVIYLNDR